ncbi:MAG: sulfatase-like hydrolase/transferase [Chloroflexota bacterium]
MTTNQRPNIVWIMSDHMPYVHHKRLTGYPTLPTYDRIAEEGIAFNNAYSVCPLCQPARASMLTGAYPHKHGMLLNDGHLGVRRDFEPDERLFNAYLHDEGYRTGYFGKWHAGIERIAKDYGFEGFSCPSYGHPYWSEEYEQYLEEQGLPSAEVTIEWWIANPQWAGRTIRLSDFPKPYEFPHLLMESCGVLNTPVETHEAYFLAHLATSWLEDVAESGEPFCLRVDPWGPHHPFWVGEPFLDTVDPHDLPQYPSFGNELRHRPQSHQDLLASRKGWSTWRTWDEFRWFLARGHEHSHLVDAAMGQVVETLDRLGLADNTIVIYTVDHGGALATNGLLVDKGWVMSDETVRIPLAIRWPDHIRPGSQTDALVTNMDLVATTLDAAQAASPDDMDSRSLLDLVQRPDDTEWREDLMIQHHGHYSQLRIQRQIRYGQYKYNAHLDDLDELYDLTQDPYELDNLIDHPDMQSVLADMRQRLKRQMEMHGDDAPEALRLLRECGL